MAFISLADILKVNRVLVELIKLIKKVLIRKTIISMHWVDEFSSFLVQNAYGLLWKIGQRSRWDVEDL